MESIREKTLKTKEGKRDKFVYIIQMSSVERGLPIL